MQPTTRHHCEMPELASDSDEMPGLENVYNPIQGLAENVHGNRLSPTDKLLKSIEGKSQTEINEQVTEHLKSENDVHKAIALPGCWDSRFILTCQNNDGLKQENTLPMLIAKGGGCYPTGTMLLQNIELPLSLQNNLPYNDVRTVQDWLKKHPIANRIDFENNLINVETCAYSAAMPLSANEGKANFAPMVHVHQGEFWVFLTYNLSGDNWGEWCMEMVSGKPFKVQAGKEGEQKDFGLYPFSKNQMQVLERTDSRVADQVKNSSVVVVGVKLEKAHQPVFHARGLVPKGMQLESACFEKCSSEYGIVGQGNVDVHRYENSSYTGRFRIASEGHFMTLGVGVPVQLDCLEKNWMEGYLEQTKVNMENALHIAKEAVFGESLETLRDRKLQQLGLPLTPKPRVEVCEKNSLLVFDYTGGQAGFDRDGFVTISDRRVTERTRFYSAEKIHNSLPQLITYDQGCRGKESLDPSRIVVFDYCNDHKEGEGYYNAYAISQLKPALDLSKRVKFSVEAIKNLGIAERSSQYLS